MSEQRVGEVSDAPASLTATGRRFAAKLCLASAWEPEVPRGGLHRSFDVGELVGDSDPAEQRQPVLM